MATKVPAMTDERLEKILGNLLRGGVILAAVVVLAGGILYEVDIYHGRKEPDNRHFHGQPPEFCSVTGILTDAASFDSRGIIQLGLLLLIATPVARVMISLLGFVLERDKTYVVVTMIVLSVLIYSLGWGRL